MIGGKTTLRIPGKRGRPRPSIHCARRCGNKNKVVGQGPKDPTRIDRKEVHAVVAWAARTGLEEAS
jgi:hypothetical protein